MMQITQVVGPQFKLCPNVCWFLQYVELMIELFDTR